MASENLTNNNNCKEDPVNPIEVLIYFENINPPLNINVNTASGITALPRLKIDSFIC